MKNSTETLIGRLLLEFSALSKEQQDRFLSVLNRYMFASPRQRKELRSGWQQKEATPK